MVSFFLFVFIYFIIENIFFLGHLLPIAIGHQCGSESADTWKWFLEKLKSAFPSFEYGVLLMDRDKGGDQATR